MKTPRPHTHLRLALAACFAFILSSARAADFTSTWNGGTANWTSTGNWSTPGAPGTFPNNGVSTYDAIQSSGSITLDQNITIQNFTLTGGILTGANTLTVAGLTTLTAHSNGGSNGASIRGGTTSAQGGLLINGGAGNVDLRGSSTVLENASTATWSSGVLVVGIGAKIKNLATGTFDNTFNGSLFGDGSGSSFDNAGTFNKTTGTGTTTFVGTTNFNNTGIVNVDSGKLSLGGGTSTGLFDVDAGATLEFNGGTHTSSGTVTGLGNLNFSGGTNTLSGTYSLTGALSATGGTSSITLGNATATSLSMSGGTLNLYGGTLTTSTFDLHPVVSGGTSIRGGDALVIVTGLTTLTAHSNGGSTGASLRGGTTQAQGGLLINGGVGNVDLLGSSTVLENASTATWSSGVLVVGIGAKIKNLATGTFDNTFNGSLVGDGSGSSFDNAGTFNKTTGTGTTSIGVAFNNTGTVNADTGTLVFSTLNMQAGTLTGAATANATTLNWSGGTLSGSGSTTVAGGTITTTNAKGLDRTLNNTGTITYNGGINASISMGTTPGAAGVINNSGTFNQLNGSAFNAPDTHGSSQINNSATGIWNVSGAGVSQVNAGIAFNNAGTVNLTNNADFPLLGNGTHTGSFTVASGTKLGAAGGTHNLNSGASVTGAGNVDASAPGGLNVNTGSTYNISGNTNVTTGAFNVNKNATTGTLTTGVGGTTKVSGATTTLTVTGATTQTGGFTTLEGGGMIVTSAYALNHGTLQGNGSITGPLTATGTGTIAPGASPGHITVNGSTVLGGSNTLAMEVGGLAAGIDYDLLTVNGILTLGGLLDVDFINGFENSVQPTDILTIATSTSSILGAFSNVASGGQLITNFSSQFRVYYGAGSPYGANNLVLTELEAVPEPSRAMLMLGGLLGVIMRRRRR